MIRRLLDILIPMAMFLAAMAALSVAIDNQARAHEDPENWIGQEKRQNAIGQ